MNSAKSPLDLSDVSVVVLSHNRLDIVGRNLESLVALANDSGCELIVVDNASTDGSAQLIAEYSRQHSIINHIASAINLGAAGGRNLGLKIAGRPYVLCIDDDTIVSREAIDQMRSYLRSNPMVGIVAPQILNPKTLKKQFYFPDDEYRPSGFHEACHLIRRAILDTVGLYDESCSFGGEGLDLSIRTRAGGYDVAYAGWVTVAHENLVRGGSEGRHRRNRWVYGFVRLHHKYFPPHLAAAFSLRFLAGHLVSGAKLFGPAFAADLVRAALEGCRDGRSARQIVPQSVIHFYADPDLSPDFGNVPLWRKLSRFVSRPSVR